MRQAILVINLGSSSLKFSIFIVEGNQLNTDAVTRGQIAPFDTATKFKIYEKNGAITEKLIQLSEPENTDIQALVFKHLLNWLRDEFSGYQLIAVGHRVVHGGNLFAQPVVVTTEILKALHTFCELAPLHQPYNLAGIEILRQQLPDAKQIACFDTAFHATQSKVAQGYTIPETIAKNLIKRYGFHGLSYEYIAQALPNYLEVSRANGKVIVAHLGHGASLCAMQDRKSVATTMGFTALEGLPMGTRCGSLDPGVILYLIGQEKMSVTEVTDLLYNQSGLLGMSQISSDIRALITNDSAQAQYAIEFFVYRIIREIGSLTAALEGLDALIFTGGIGEHHAEIREKICQSLKWLNISLDVDANRTRKTTISSCEHSIPILIIPTNEELMIAQHTWCCVKR